MNYYTFQINDYAKCAAHLSPTEDLVYRRMLDLYYVNECPLNSNTDRIARRIGMIENIEEVKYILSEYFVKTKDGFVNRRCEKEIAKYHEKVLRAKRAIKSRWKPSNKRNISDTDKIPTNNNNTINNSSKEIYKEKDFNLFWENYPKKVKKKDAVKIWKRENPPIDLVMNALAWQVGSKDWKEESGKYIPHPTTYLNQNQWENEPTGSSNIKAIEDWANK